jgi:hypothetical protein
MEGYLPFGAARKKKGAEAPEVDPLLGKRLTPLSGRL